MLDKIQAILNELRKNFYFFNKPKESIYIAEKISIHSLTPYSAYQRLEEKAQQIESDSKEKPKILLVNNSQNPNASCLLGLPICREELETALSQIVKYRQAYFLYHSNSRANWKQAA